MKRLYLVTTLFALSGCTTNPPQPSASLPSRDVAEAIRAFENVCLKTAPSFSGAAQAAREFGIVEISDFEFMKSGFNKDQSLGVQIKADNECVITTPEQKDNTLTRQFLQTVSKYAGKIPSVRTPIKAGVNGVTFIFLHDRKGGEAYVMLKAKG
jgi:hypothetical protein